MDPWSKVDYSRIIREASMLEEKLPEVNPPADRVPGRGLLALPILEARRQWKRGEITKKGYVFQGFPSQRIYMRRGAVKGATKGPGAPLGNPTLGRVRRAPGA